MTLKSVSLKSNLKFAVTSLPTFSQLSNNIYMIHIICGVDQWLVIDVMSNTNLDIIVELHSYFLSLLCRDDVTYLLEFCTYSIQCCLMYDSPLQKLLCKTQSLVNLLQLLISNYTIASVLEGEFFELEGRRHCVHQNLTILTVR